MIAKKLMKIKKTNKIDVRDTLFHNAEDLRHKALMTLELNCEIEIFGFENKDHLREYTKDLNDILFTHPDSYQQIINDKDLTYKIIRLE